MPIGMICNLLGVVLGGLVGSTISKFLPQLLKDDLNKLFGFAAMIVGITLVVKVSNLGAVVLTIIFAVSIGTLLNIDSSVTFFANKIVKKVCPAKLMESFDIDQFSTAVALFAFGATGIIGVLMEVTNGDSSILMYKTVLDFFTAVIFATKLGISVSLIAIPQFMVYMLCYLLSGLISQFMTGKTYGDFQAVGGMVNLIVSFRILKLCDLKPMNAILSLFLIIPVSLLWQNLF